MINIANNPTGFSLVNKQEWILFSAGINLTLLNFILVQHVGVAFRNPELAILTFSLSYFSGISLGYFLSDHLSGLSLKWLLPAMLPMQMLTIITSQAGAYLIQRDVSLFATIHQLSANLGWFVAYLTAFLLITLTATSIYAIFLPFMIGDNREQLQRLYSIEIGGSIVGLLLIPLLTSFSHQLLLFVYFAIFMVIAALLHVNKIIIMGLILSIIIFISNFSTWDTHLSTWFYQHWYTKKSIEHVEYTRYTPYHKIDVLKLDNGQFMLALNGKRQFSHTGHFNYSYFLAEYPAKMFKNPRVNLLGCGVMSTIGRIGDFVKTITIVDIDQEVFNTSRKYFQAYNRLDSLHNWQFIADDAKHFIANSNEYFELILHDIPPAYSRQIALTYTHEFFNLIKQRLTDNGIFSIASLSPISKRSYYGKRLIYTLTQAFDQYFILIKGSSVYFYGGRETLQIPNKETLRAAIQHKAKDNIKIYINAEVDQLVKNTKLITINNIGDLIFDD